MSGTPENPPAFPLQFGNALKETLAKKQEGESDQDFTLRLARHRDGMSLRDYFAAKVIAEMASSGNFEDASYLRMATECYKVADAMLKAREQCHS